MRDDRHQEMSDLISVRRPVSIDDPGMRRVAGRASGGDQDVGLARQKVRDREGVPRAATPPQRRGSHHREAQRDGGEGMCHHDAVPVQYQVTRGRQAPQAISHIVFVGTEGSSKTVDVRTRSGGSETAIDREPHVLVVDDHPATLERWGFVVSGDALGEEQVFAGDAGGVVLAFEGDAVGAVLGAGAFALRHHQCAVGGRRAGRFRDHQLRRWGWPAAGRTGCRRVWWCRPCRWGRSRSRCRRAISWDTPLSAVIAADQGTFSA